MRHARLALGGLLLLLVGCNPLRPGPKPEDQQAIRSQATPTAESLVTYLIANAKLIQSVDCGELFIDAHAGSEGVSLVDCWMVCQKPRNFRMTAKILGSNGVDMGSNENEFWWWISKSDPAGLFHCSYEDMATKQVRMPFPFQPEWIMEGMGMTECGPVENYTVNATPHTVELIEPTKTAMGTPARKVTVFSRNVGQGNAPVVTAHLIQDMNGKVICGAYVMEVQRDAASGAVLPRVMRLEWPEQKMTLKMTMKKIGVNQPIEQQRFARLFTRPQMQGVPTYDLARGADQPQGTAIRQTRGVEPQR